MKWILLGVVVAGTALTDLLQSHGLKRAGEQSVNARGLVRLFKTIIARPALILSVVCMAISFFAFMALLQAAPLSFAVPASAASFILETVLAKLVLKEEIGPRRTAGALLVLGGVVLLAR